MNNQLFFLKRGVTNYCRERKHKKAGTVTPPKLPSVIELEVQGKEFSFSSGNLSHLLQLP